MAEVAHAQQFAVAIHREGARCLVREEIAARQLAIAFDLPIKMQRGYFFCVPSGRPQAPGVAEFRAWLLESAMRDIASMAVRHEQPSPKIS